MTKSKVYFHSLKKRVMSVFMAVLIIMGLIPSNIVKALVISKGENTGYEFVHDINQRYGTMPAIKFDPYGNLAYCMEITKNTPTGQDFDEGENLDDVAYRILKNGYPNRSITGDRLKDYFITQSAFWLYVDSGQANYSLFKARKLGNIGVEDKELTQAVRDLYNLAINGEDTQKINVNFSQSNLEAIFDGNNYVTPLLRINVTGALEQSELNIKMSRNIDGIKYQLSDGTFVDKIPINTDFRVIIPKESKEGSVSLMAEGKVKGARVVVYKSPRSDIQDVAKWDEIELDAKSLNYAKITWNTKGSLEVIKTNDFGELVDGAKFALIDINNGNIIAQDITIAGKLIFEDIESGIYNLVELEAAQGHVNDFKPQRVEILPGNNVRRVEIENKIIKGRVKIAKKDSETGELLQGAKFELYDKERNLVDTLVTGIDGLVTSGLHRFGEYLLKEVKAPDKYVLDDKEYNINITSNEELVELVHSNRIIKGKVEINKTDSELANLKLEEVVFGIYDSKNTLVEKLTTDENGYAISKNLNYGDYILKELETKNGYLLNNQEWKIEIREDGKVLTYNIKNDVIKGKIQIVKVDSMNVQKPVKGAVFGVYAKNVFSIDENTKVDEITTDENGFAFTKDLRFGEYYLQEISVGDDYYLNTNKYPVVISENGKVEVVHIKNEPVKMKIRVVKYDNQDNSFIKGTKFKIINTITGKDVEFTDLFGIIPIKKTVFTTDKNGEIIFPQSIPHGRYELVEVEPSEGYNSIDPIPFEITRDTKFDDMELIGKVATINVSNTRIKGTVELLKLDTDTKEPMKNVEFLVEALSGFDKGKTWTYFTGEDGIIKLEKFNYGKYQIKEVKTLEGYVLNSKPVPFEINKNGQEIKLQMTNDRIKGNVELLKLDTDTKEPMKNVEFLVEALSGFDKGKTWTYFTGEDGIIKLEKFNYGKYQIKEVKTLEGYILNSKPVPFEINKNGQEIKLQMTNDRIKGDMKLLKLDSKTGEALANVRFKITGITGFNEGKEFKLYSNDYGIVELRDLEYGSYRVDEIETANKGYVLNSNPIYFEIKENGQKIELEMTNDRIKGNMELLKVDEDTNKVMPFVKFKISAVDTFDKDQEYILESNNDGIIRLDNLEAGVYRVDEIETVEGYVLNTQPMFFTIKENGETVKLQMTNRVKKGNVELLKVDEDTNRPLKGVEFELIKGDEVIGTYTTDENGKIVVENLPWGSYHFVEIKADDRYILNQDIFYNFFIEEDGQKINLVAKNKVKTGDVDFSKTDISTGELIEGAKIEIKGLDENNNHIKIEFTSTKEETRFKLPVGKYEFKEIVAPEGYVLSEEVGEFEIKENEIVKAELKNKRIVGKLEFEKTDVVTGEVIEGAHIKIECVEGFNKGQVIEFVSSKDGNKFELEYGKYKFYETIAPNGYQLSTEVGEFEITEDGKVVKCKLENNRLNIPETGDNMGLKSLCLLLILSLLIIIGLFSKSNIYKWFFLLK